MPKRLPQRKEQCHPTSLLVTVKDACVPPVLALTSAHSFALDWTWFALVPPKRGRESDGRGSFPSLVVIHLCVTSVIVLYPTNASCAVSKCWWRPVVVLPVVVALDCVLEEGQGIAIFAHHGMPNTDVH
uniref:Uncharacterized protein n=1 Tax=Craspedostauros australis TaxID=1486917 RepID=A0A7R9WL68_9STRA